MLQTDARFRGMLEVYGLFRGLVAHDHLATEKEAIFAGISESISDLTSKLGHVDTGLTVLVRHMNQVNPDKMPKQLGRSVQVATLPSTGIYLSPSKSSVLGGGKMI